MQHGCDMNRGSFAAFRIIRTARRMESITANQGPVARKDRSMVERVKLKEADRLGDDLIWGISGNDGIAAYLGLSDRRTYYLVERGKLPVHRLGPKTIVASKSELRARLSARTRGGDNDR
jgi:excisionase family DNA binding protein